MSDMSSAEMYTPAAAPIEANPMIFPPDVTNAKAAAQQMHMGGIIAAMRSDFLRAIPRLIQSRMITAVPAANASRRNILYGDIVP